MIKRPTLKGKGADIFLEKEKKESLRERTHIPTRKEKATFYLPSSILKNLDSVWLSFREENRKIKKSDLVGIALKQAIEDFEKNKKGSMLSKHFTSIP